MNKNPDDSNNKGIYGEIEIYHNQYNIGQVIVNSFVKLGAISDKIEDLRKYDSIHVHVLGPVFTTLRDQTKADLTRLRRGRGPNSINFDVVNQAKDLEWIADDRVFIKTDDIEELILKEYHEAFKCLCSGTEPRNVENDLKGNNKGDSIHGSEPKEQKNMIYGHLKSLWDSNEGGISAVRVNTKDKAKSLKEELDVILKVANKEDLFKIHNTSDDQFEYDDFIKSHKKKRHLLILVDKVRMGVRVPDPLYFWDVRCCYKGVINSWATFVQDIGRCAGHTRTMKPIILLGKGLDELKDLYVNLVSKEGKSLEEIKKARSKFVKKLDGLLTTKNQTATKHPESLKQDILSALKGVYSELKDHLVLLEAEPQVGKTGAMLAFIDIIDKAVLHAIPRKDLSSNRSELSMMTEEGYKKRKRGGFDSFLDYMNPLTFQKYHKHNDELNKKDGAPATVFAKLIIDGINDGSELSIVDAGCGTGHLLKMLYNLLKERRDRDNAFGIKKDYKVNVIAIDVAKSDPIGLEENDILTYKYIDMDYEMKLIELESNSIDYIIFSISIMTDDITEIIRQSYRILKKNGFIHIALLGHCFTEEVKNCIETYGFSFNIPHTFEKMKLLVIKKEYETVKNENLPKVVLSPMY